MFLSVGAFAQISQFKLTSGTLLVTPQAGGLEYNGTNFFTTNGALTRTQVIATAAAGTSGTFLMSQGAGVTPTWGTPSGISAVTSANCTYTGTGNCTATCAATYLRTGCSSGSANNPATTVAPSGSTACICTGSQITGGGTCYAYCAK